MGLKRLACGEGWRTTRPYECDRYSLQGRGHRLVDGQLPIGLAYVHETTVRRRRLLCVGQKAPFAAMVESVYPQTGTHVLRSVVLNTVAPYAAQRAALGRM